MPAQAGRSRVDAGRHKLSDAEKRGAANFRPGPGYHTCDAETGEHWPCFGQFTADDLGEHVCGEHYGFGEACRDALQACTAPLRAEVVEA